MTPCARSCYCPAMAARTPSRPASGELPLLPLRSMSLLPGLPQPIELGRSTSVGAIENARALPPGDPFAKLVIVATQRDPLVERPDLDDLYPVGLLAEVTQALRGVPGRMTAIVRGLHRVRLLGLHRGPETSTISYQLAHETMGDPTLAYALAGALQDLVRQHDEALPAAAKNRNRAQTLAVLTAERSPGAICDLAATHIDLAAEQSVEVLMELQVTERLRKMLEHVGQRINVLHVKRDLDKHVRDHLSQHEQEALLRHKLRAIQSQLSDDSADEDAWIDTLAERLEHKSLTEHAHSEVARELDRLRRMNPQSQEANIARTYVELMADLPWGDADATEDKLDLPAARALLERDHFGLEKVKKRIIEYLSVRKLAPGKRGPLLCLAGPPGVGKTSLAKSIAESLGRTFVRMSLGGVRDDAEVRGHRRTYVGALPGRLIQLMRKAGTTNPVFLLDEIDKLGGDANRGDPASAFLEALDPEQNNEFEDHYLGTPYDLSKVIFICTANDVSKIPLVLRDRLEFIDLAGYTLQEKISIAREYLLPRAILEHGLSPDAVEFDEEAFDLLATRYTRESGVRNLQRQVEAMLRDVAMGWVEAGENGAAPVRITAQEVERVLGPPRYEEDHLDREPAVGVVNGLGWTSTGGRLLIVEAATTPGKGTLRLTGRLGEVMKESGQAAVSLIRSRALKFGIDPAQMRKLDLHVHFPAGAVPKDGPSAGITVTTALVSRLTGRRVRNDLAMTGEITLHGRVLAIGGVREKVLAAHRAGAKTVILPSQNRKDEPEIPEAVRKDIELCYVDRIEDVLKIALLEADPVVAAS